MCRPPVYAIILAAGASSRMGCTKQLLQLDGKSLLEQVVSRIMTHPFERILIVTGHEEETIRKSVAVKSERLIWIRNESYQSGQNSSLVKGIEQASRSVRGVMVFLADQPFISSSTISTVFEKGAEHTATERGPFSVRPVYKKVPGHPVFLGNSHLLALDSLGAGERGGLTLIKQGAHYPLKVDDPLVAVDIDTPSDYRDAKRMLDYLTEK